MKGEREPRFFNTECPSIAPMINCVIFKIVVDSWVENI